MDTTPGIDTNSLFNLGVDPNLHPLLASISILPGVAANVQTQLYAPVDPLLVGYITPVVADSTFNTERSFGSTLLNPFGTGVENAWVISGSNRTQSLDLDAAPLDTLFPIQPLPAVQLAAAKASDRIVRGKALAVSQIQDFLNRPDRFEQFKIAFGQDLEPATIERVIANWQAEGYKLPDIEIIPSQVLGKTDGGFDAANNKIYLSSNLIERGNSAEIVPVIIEEIGHYLDTKIHPGSDATGDEGEIFSRLVRGINISNSEYVTLVNEDDRTTIILNSTPVNIEQAVTTNYAIKAEKIVSFNGSSDLDGNSLDLSDDALVYGGKGFSLNGNSILPVKYDVSGNPVKDSQGKLVLVERAITVAAGYLQANVGGNAKNKYAGLNPPQIVSTEIVTAPLFADLKQQELNRKIPTGTPTTIFNIGTSPINNLTEWGQKFPAAGTSDRPTVVRVTGGGLNIPDNIALSNYVIIVDNGDLNFNGTSNLNNVTLVTNNGNINLNKAQTDNLLVLASGTITENSNARFGGKSLLANGTGNITFNGATKGIAANDNLWVISAGGITFNGSQSTRGSFLAQGDFIANGSADIYGTVSSKQNITFNGALDFTYANIAEYSEGNPPVIVARLVNDSGMSISDRITNDERISGTITDANQIVEFKAGFDDLPLASYTDVLSALETGSFSFTKVQLEQIYGGTIPDGLHTLNLIATDKYNNQSSVYAYTFTLDPTTPVPTVNLAATSDTGVVGDYRTKSPLVTLTGQTEANAKVFLSGNPTPVAADSLGIYSFENVALGAGNNSFTVTVTDLAGNQNTYTRSIYRTSPPTAVNLATPQVLENSADDTVIGVLSTSAPDPVDSYTYSLIDDAGGRFKLVGDKIQVANGSLLNFEVNTQHQIQVQTIDSEGDSYLQSIDISVIDVNESPNNLVVLPTVILENSPSDTIVGTITSTDPDLGNSFTYSLVDGTGNGDNSKFAIVDDKLVIKNLPNYETQASYTLRLKTTDAGGLSYEKQVTVNVTDANEAPLALNITNTTVTETALGGVVVGELSALDPDANDTQTFSLVTGAGDTDNSAFNIVNNQLRFQVTPNFETQSNYSLRVKTTDAGGLSVEKVLTVNITNINEAPTLLVLDANSASENSEIGTLIGKFTTTDPDLGDSHTYSLVTGNGSGDNPKFTIAGNELRLNISPDFETQSVYYLRVQTADAGGLTWEQELTVRITDVNESAATTLLEGTSFNKQLDIPITIPTTGGKLSFKLDPLQFDGTDLKGINDALEVILVDAGGKSLVTPFQAGRDAFFNWTEGESVVTGDDASYDSATGIVTLNLTGVTPGSANLIFRLLNNDTDTTTTVTLNDLTFAPNSPLPLPLSPLPLALSTPTPVSPTFFNTATDVSSSIVADYQRTSFNATTKELDVNVALKNQGSYGLNGTLVVVVKNISDPSVNVKDADGFTPEGLPYYTFTASNGKLDPTQVTDEQTLLFKNPNGVQFSYELMVLAEINAAPVIKSSPELEVIGGKNYQYQIQAEDLNGDSLSYKLLSAPSGMSIDPSTGLVSWNTSTGAVGNYQLVVEVSDGRGEIVQQNYNLAVITPPPNRPVVFTSTPVVDAAIGSIYNYRALAKDPEGAFVTYYLISSPTGMSVDVSTGVLTWNPTGSQLGNSDVIIGATDGLGGVAYQQFKIRTGAAVGNRAPIVIGDAVTLATIGKPYSYQVKAVDPDADLLVYSLERAPSGMTIDPNTGLVKWTPNNNIPTTPVSVAIKVRDNLGGEDTQTFEINPIVESLGKISGQVYVDDGRANSQVVYFNDFEDPNRSLNEWSSQRIDTSPIGGQHFLGQFGGYYYGYTPNTSNSAQLALSNLPEHDSITIDLDLYIINSWDGSGWDSFRNPGVWNPDWLDVSVVNGPKLLHATFGGGSYPIARTQSYPDPYLGNDYYLSPNPGNLNYAGTGATSRNTLGYNYGGDSTYHLSFTFDHSNSDVIFSWFGGTNEGLDNESWGIDNVKITADRKLTGIGNQKVFLDTNANHKLDSGEIFTTTNEQGKYSFDLTPENYKVAVDVPVGWQQSYPTTSYQIDLTNSQQVTNRNFGLLAGGNIGANEVAPKFLSNPVKSATIGREYRYSAFARDDNFDRLTYDLVSKPDGMVINADTGIISWVPNTSSLSKANVVVRVADGRGGVDLQAFSISVDSPNSNPVLINPQPGNPNITSLYAEDRVRLGDIYKFQFKALDSDGDSVTYRLAAATAQAGVTTNNIGATIDSQTGLFSWNTDNSNLTYYANTLLNVYSFTVEASDGRGGRDFQTFALELTALSTLNLPPVIASTPRTQTSVGQTYFYQIAATDPNSDPLTYSLIAPPAGMSVNNQGLLTWTPTAAQLGQAAIKIQVSDGRGGVVTQQFGLDVVSSGSIINNSPEITSTPTFTTNLGKTYTYQLTGTDSDNDTLVWSLDRAPTGMVIDSATGILKWNPTSSQIGNQTIAVRLSDAYGLYVGQEYTLKVNGVNTPPTIQSSPNTNAGVNSPYKYQIKAIDSEGDAIQYTLGRRPTGMVVDNNTGLITWTPNATQVGTQIIDILVTDTQGAVTTQTYNLVVGTTPINQAPTITSIPKFTADTNSQYKYQVVGTDPENSQITYALATAPTGMVIDASTGLITWNNPTLGNTNIKITATDPNGAVAVQEYTLTGKQNRAPVINSTPKTQVTLGNTYRYDVLATDSDNDALVYSLDNASLVAGVSIDKLGRITWKPTTVNLGIKPVTVTVTDTNGATVTQTYNLEVLADNIAPTINLVRGTNIADIGETISFQVQATDNVGIKSTQLVIDSQTIGLDANGVGTYTVTTAGIITATAIVTDVNGNTSTKNTTVNVIDPTDVDAPNIGLDLSGITDGIITGRTDIIGTVTDTNLDYYTLEVARWGTDNWQEVFRGTGNVNNGTLGKFDPSLLENDSYRVRLTAFDTSGRGSQVEDEIEVTGDLKLGNFRLSFTDLTIPVTGIPISLTRTYDSLTSGTTDDFGYGWRMEFRDTDLRTSLKKDEFYEQLDYRTVGFNFGTRIYITLPGGKREGFTFEPQLVQGALGGLTGGRLYYPSFVSDKGVTSTLTVPGAEIKAYTSEFSSKDGISGNPNGILMYKEGKLFNLAGRPYVPQDDGFGNRYILTTKDGTQYEINATTGDLETVTDTNGNTLTYSDTAIVSSTGVQVTFERDNQGRITSVTDPLGQKVQYGYDAKGDLVSVTDRDGNTTGFGYNSSRDHYLEKIVDPLGREAVKTEYDEQGRLKKTANSSGNGVEFVYNPANSLETVKDALGNATTYEYDTRGNVVTEVDAVGKVTKRAYDDDNRMLSERVISERSGANGFTTTYTYDRQGNKLSETDALGNTTYYSYGEKGRLLTSTDALGRTTTNAFDGNGNLISTKDAKGQTISFSYGNDGKLLSMTDIVGKTSSSYTYDVNGNLASATDILGHVINYNHDAQGHLLSETQKDGTRILTNRYTYDNQGNQLTSTDALNHTTTYTYNSLGQQVAFTDALGRVTRMVYDNNGRLIETILPDATPNDLTDNPRTRTQYDAMGREIATIDEAGKITRMVYDAVGRLIETIEPDDTPNDLTDNPRTKTEYYSDGLLKANIDQLGHRTEYRHDALGRLIAVIYADNTPNDLSDNPTSRTVYNAVGQITQSIDPLGRVTKYIYDDLGRLTITKFADGSEASTEYDKIGRKIAAVDQNSNRTEYRYDDLGRLLGVVDALQNSTTYSYGEMGWLLSMTDAEQHTTNYEYDDLGRRTATVMPLSQRSTTSYDAVGNLITSTDFNGRTTTFSYDVQNRMTDKLFQDGSKVTYIYTIDGLLDITTIFSSNGQVNSVYDQDYDVRNQLIKRTDTIDGVSLAVSHTYDLAGNRTSVSTPNNTTYYTYDERNRLKTVTNNASGTTRYNYNVNSNLVQTLFANGVVENRNYDILNRLLNLVNKKSDGTTLSGYHYTLDNVGNRTKVTEANGRTVDYTYDKLHRLVSETITDLVNGNHLTTFTYDRVSNRLTQAQDAVTTVYSYDANDRLLSEKVNAQPVITYTYDNNGSTLTKSELNKLTQYTWNDDKRLIGATITDNNGGTQQLGYRYDNNGIRVSSIVNGDTTRYLLDTVRAYAQVLSEYQGNNVTPTVSYVYGRDLISQTRAGNSDYYLVDGLGSKRVLTDSQGNVTNAYDYEAFGKLLNSAGNGNNSYLFAGEQFDKGLGDYYLRDRFYNSKNGRFTRQDTYLGNLQSPLSLNKYIYGYNNPITLSDPTGFAPGDEFYKNLDKIGKEVHRQVGLHFVSFNPPERRSNITIKRILREADGITYNGIYHRARPDLINYTEHGIYEIKSNSKRAEGYLELIEYLAVLNLAPGSKPAWNDGSLYVYTPIFIPFPQYNKVAVVEPSIFGVVVYHLKDLRNGNDKSDIIDTDLVLSTIGSANMEYVTYGLAFLIAGIALRSSLGAFA
jgi:RHS repeat-associated protein